MCCSNKSYKEVWCRRDKEELGWQTSKDEYYELLEINAKQEENKTLSYTEKALAEAQRVRQFEISLFWTRSTFYWVFIAFLFTAYGSMILKLLLNENLVQSHLKNYYLEIFIFLSIINLIGLMLSYIWYKVVESSKYWQDHWEAHINMLEGEVTGHLHKVMLRAKKPILSVSKLCMLLAQTCMLVWFITQFFFTFYFPQENVALKWLIFSAYIITYISATCIICSKTRSTSVKC